MPNNTPNNTPRATSWNSTTAAITWEESPTWQRDDEGNWYFGGRTPDEQLIAVERDDSNWSVTVDDRTIRYRINGTGHWATASRGRPFGAWAALSTVYSDDGECASLWRHQDGVRLQWTPDSITILPRSGETLRISSYFPEGHVGSRADNVVGGSAAIPPLLPSRSDASRSGWVPAVLDDPFDVVTAWTWGDTFFAFRRDGRWEFIVQGDSIRYGGADGRFFLRQTCAGSSNWTVDGSVVWEGHEATHPSGWAIRCSREGLDVVPPGEGTPLAIDADRPYGQVIPRLSDDPYPVFDIDWPGPASPVAGVPRRVDSPTMIGYDGGMPATPTLTGRRRTLTSAHLENEWPTLAQRCRDIPANRRHLHSEIQRSIWDLVSAGFTRVSVGRTLGLTTGTGAREEVHHATDHALRAESARRGVPIPSFRRRPSADPIPTVGVGSWAGTPTFAPQVRRGGVSIPSLPSPILAPEPRQGTEPVTDGDGLLILGRAFGVEVEYNGPGARPYDLAIALRNAGIEAHHEDYNHSVRPHWKCTTDASVTGGECVSPILRGRNAIEQVRTVMHTITAEGGLVNNRNCGTHVHHNVNDFDRAQLINLVANLRHAEKALLNYVPDWRNGANHVSAMTDHVWRSVASYAADGTFDAPGSSRRGRDYGIGRYYTFNFCSILTYGTVEFRAMSGTLNATKLEAWIGVGQALVEFSRRNLTFGEVVSTDTMLTRLVTEGLLHRRLARRFRVRVMDIHDAARLTRVA